MRAVTVSNNAISVQSRPTPSPEPGEVVVRVHGAGLNRADLLQRAGLYPAPPGSPVDIPGLEFSGVVAALGEPARGTSTARHDIAIGDRVFGVCGGGGHSESIAVPGAHCARVPDDLDLVAMGGVPEAFVTAHDAMVTNANVAAGDWLLVHAVGSGVGTAAVQLAKAMGARVIGTARTADKLDRCTALGLDVGIVPPRNGDGSLDTVGLANLVREATDGHGADVTLDLVGGAYFEAEVMSAAPRGRIVLIGTLAGGRASMNILGAMQARLTIRGTVLRPRSIADKAAATVAFERDVVPLLASRSIGPIVERTISLDDAHDAYELLATDTTFGKLILDCR